MQLKKAITLRKTAKKYPMKLKAGIPPKRSDDGCTRIKDELNKSAAIIIPKNNKLNESSKDFLKSSRF